MRPLVLTLRTDPDQRLDLSALVPHRLTHRTAAEIGKLEPGGGRVLAIAEWVRRNVEYRYGTTDAKTSAFDTATERIGVCRDFAHLAITLCRCLNIPARYCTGYLGDIGVPKDPAPMDFAGWFEAYLGGAWHTFDPRNNVPRIGRVLIARGRDAADVAITTTFGPNTLQSFRVWTDEVTT